MSSPAERIRQNSGQNVVDEPESAIWSGRYSAKTMIGSWVAAAVASIVVPILLALSPIGGRTIWLVLLILLAGLWLWLIATAFYRKFSHFYELTTQRLKHRDGILFRKANRLELIDIDDVSFHQGPVQAILGLGTITIESSDTSHPKLNMYGIANVHEVADKIDNARRAERRKRGLHIEAV